MIFFGSIAGYRSVETVKHLTESKIIELELLMQSFPSSLKTYARTGKIEMTTSDEHCIYACFNDSGTINPMNDFRSFSFRHGDKLKVLQVAHYVVVNMKHKGYFKACNPNSTLPTISTVIGDLYGVDVDIKKSIVMLKGMKLSPVQKNYRKCACVLSRA